VKSRVIAKPRKRVVDCDKRVKTTSIHLTATAPPTLLHETYIKDLLLFISILGFYPRIPRTKQNRSLAKQHPPPKTQRPQLSTELSNSQKHDRTHQTQTPQRSKSGERSKTKTRQKCHQNSTHPAPPPRPPHPYQKAKVDDLRAARTNRNPHHPASRKANPHLP
jgi:hypothetical protein